MPLLLQVFVCELRRHNCRERKDWGGEGRGGTKGFSSCSRGSSSCCCTPCCPRSASTPSETSSKENGACEDSSGMYRHFSRFIHCLHLFRFQRSLTLTQRTLRTVTCVQSMPRTSLTTLNRERWGKLWQLLNIISGPTSDTFNHLFYCLQEKFVLSNYMHMQPHLNPEMRAILIDWLVEVQVSFYPNWDFREGCVAAPFDTKIWFAPLFRRTSSCTMRPCTWPLRWQTTTCPRLQSTGSFCSSSAPLPCSSPPSLR